MANAHETSFNALKEELVIGPEHHRFQLVSKQRDHFAGQLWLAEDISTAARTQVSLLVLWPALAGHAEAVKVVRRLAQQNRTVNHPHIVRLYGHFSWRGLEFLSLEHLSGQTLSDLFQRKQAAKLSAKQKQGLLTQLAKALERHSTPHYLLAPDCVFLNPGGGVKLFGFGWRPVIAPLADSLPVSPEFLRYQPPEAFHAHPSAEQADVYALAVLTWELYSGKPAFQPKEGESARFQREFKAPPGFSKQQWKHLNGAMNPSPEQRPDSCIELMRALFTDETESKDEPVLDTKSLEQDDSPQDMPAVEEQVQEPLPPAPEQETPAVSDTAPAAAEETTQSSPRRRLWTPGPTLRRWLGWTLAYLLGLGSGFWIALLLFQGQLDSLSSQALTLMKDNRELRAAFESMERERDRLAQTLDAANTEAASQQDTPPAKPIPSAEEMRDDDQGFSHLTVFQDELEGGGRGPQMVVIPPGRFRMGDLHGQGDDNERPVHEVTIAHNFALARLEVTFAEFDRFAEATGRPLPSDEGWGRGNRPVVNVTWQDADAYARWLAEQTGQPYRLPTEAEWEYSARAGTESLFWWGDEMQEGYAVCDGCDSRWGSQSTAPTGSMQANPWGLHDLSGNVDEWVADCYQADYSQAPKDGSAEQMTGCSQRVMRGGSWFDIPRLTRPASRYRHPANTSRNSWGFRVALDLPDTSN